MSKRNAKTPKNKGGGENADGSDADAARELLSEDIGDSEEMSAIDMSLIRNILAKGGKDGEKSPGGFETPTQDRKVVSFSGVDSPSSSVPDKQKGLEDWVKKVDKLQTKLKQAEIDLSAEKTVRKKKERNLVKLAKELNKRAGEQGEREKEVTKLKDEISEFERKLSQAKGDLDEKVRASENKSKEQSKEIENARIKHREVLMAHEEKLSNLGRAHGAELDKLKAKMKKLEDDLVKSKGEIDQGQKKLKSQSASSSETISGLKKDIVQAQKKHREATDQHESRMAAQNKKHTAQTEELRREILTARLEGDRLRSQLARMEMQLDPTNTEAIASRALRASFDPSARKRFGWRKLLGWFAAIIAVLVAIAYQMKLFSSNSRCAPVPPGSVLDRDGEYEAPWWAPDPVKEKAFELFCASRPKTSLSVSSGRFVITDQEGKVLVNRKVDSAIVHEDHLKLIDKKGSIDTLKSPWSREV